MAAFQPVIRQIMIEMILVQPDDLRTAPLVVAVARPALFGRCFFRTAMKTLLTLDICVNFFVTIEAQSVLRRVAPSHMTILAIAFQLRMAGNQLAR